MFKVTGLNAAAGTTGIKTVRVQVEGTGATNAFQSVAIVPRPNPPHVFVAKEPPKAPWAPGGSTWFPQADQLYRAKIDEVVAEFPNAHAVDLAPGWDNDVMVSSYDSALFHPNDWGQQHIANEFVKAILSEISGPTPGVVRL